jgi:hypothetical protein
MLKFIISAFGVTALCSLIKFSLNLGLMRYIKPNELIIYGLVVIIWGFIEIFIEQGTQALTIKNGITPEKAKIYILEYAKKTIFISSLILLIYIFASKLFSIPLNMNYIFIAIMVGVGTFIKLVVLLLEAQKINEGKYNNIQFMELFSTSVVYSVAILIIDRNRIGGELVLTSIFLAQPIMYSIFYFRKIFTLVPKFFLSQPSSLAREIIKIEKKKEEEVFKKNVVQSGVFDYASTKSDEFVAFLIFNNSMFGIYLKFKDFASIVAGFGSRVISRPWFYACTKYRREEIIRYLLLILLMQVLLIIGGLCIPSEIYEIAIVTVLTSNWEVLASNGKLLYQFACITFIYIFLKYTLSGVGAQARQTLIDSSLLKITLSVLSIVIIYNLFYKESVTLDLLIYLLIAIKFYGISLQLISLHKLLCIQPAK